MSDKTKSCNLTEEEIEAVMFHHADFIRSGSIDARVDRINYLNKRLKTFAEVEITADTDAIKNEGVKAASAPAPAVEKVGW